MRLRRSMTSPMNRRSAPPPLPSTRWRRPGANAALARLQQDAGTLGEFQRKHRSETLKAVGGAEALTADQAMARIETVRRLEAMTRHAWRAAAHLLGHTDDAT